MDNVVNIHTQQNEDTDATIALVNETRQMAEDILKELTK